MESGEMLWVPWGSKMDAYDSMLRLQESLLSPVKSILIFLSALLLIFLAVYLLTIYSHYRRAKYVKRKTPKWQGAIRSLLLGEISVEGVKISSKDRGYLRDILIAEFSGRDSRGREDVRSLYKKLGFFEDDLKGLKSRTWWKRIHAILRLGQLQIADADEQVFALLEDERSEVRFSALDMLASNGSEKLPGIICEIFEKSSRWSYRYLVNILFPYQFPAGYLTPMATSKNRDLRKAAAILLGNSEDAESVPALANLANDDVKDVRREAVHSIGRIAAVEGLPVIECKIGDDEPQVRAEAARALGEIQDPHALYLLDRLADDPDFDVRFKAFFALGRFGEGGRRIIKKYEAMYPEMAGEFLKNDP